MHRLFSGLALLLTLTFAPAVTAEAGTATGGGAVEAAARADGLVVRPRAWGPLRLRMTAAQAQATGLVSREPSACSTGFQMTTAYAERGLVLWRGPYGSLRVGGIVVRTAADRTENGAGVGTSLRELRRLYPRLSAPVSYSQLHGQDRQPKRDMWTVSVRASGAHRSFQFPYGAKPSPRSRVEMIVVAPKPTVWVGC